LGVVDMVIPMGANHAMGMGLLLHKIMGVLMEVPKRMNTVTPMAVGMVTETVQVLLKVMDMDTAMAMGTEGMPMEAFPIKRLSWTSLLLFFLDSSSSSLKGLPFPSFPLPS